ncbi:hypothetical protein ASG67_10000 [Sphingomonas sp. Leaf339]|uniref:hypothetical protein n=1 Tax=Sphingomonas sp. Leaf339 TaxID=1736343 RepID=UPI0006FA76DC|nr:hypothetical protein [Sphingomonas sp. Leaf339]KQU53148.1 hypothetical protein ASG67_10000 [Sphingomonas sp. Leaf339]
MISLPGRPALAIWGTVLATAFATTAAAQTAPTTTEPVSASPFDVATIDDTALHDIAGRADTAQIATNTQNAGVSRNSIGDNATTGNAQIADNAFQNMSGLSILNVNTGNNVAINAAMAVNISITPGQ